MAFLTSAVTGISSSVSLCPAKLGLAASPKVAAGGKVAMVPVRVAAKSQEEKQEMMEAMQRRALVVGAFAALLATVSSLQQDGAMAEEDPKKKRNKCPTLCVQNPTASCCFSF